MLDSIDTSSMFASSAKTIVQEESQTTRMLDSLQRLMTGNSNDQFDRFFYSQLLSCMKTLDPQLIKTQEGFYKGWVKYWKSFPEKFGENRGFAEHNPSSLDYLNMTVYEPCNTMSNLGFYRALIDTCSRKVIGPAFKMPDVYVRAVGRAFAPMAYTSMFMHGSNTKAGGVQDVASIGVYSFLVYQAMASQLPTNSTIIKDMSHTPRLNSALEVLEKWLLVHRSAPVFTWSLSTRSLNIPHYFDTFSGIIVFALMMVDPNLAVKLSPQLADQFNIPEDVKSFIIDVYIPELRTVIEPLKIKPQHKLQVLKKFIGPLIKLVYAFVWQENTFDLDDKIFRKDFNTLGFTMMPVVHKKANSFTGFVHYDKTLQKALGVYPGEKACATTIAHCKWHVGAAAGILDLFYFGDVVYGVLQETLKKN